MSLIFLLFFSNDRKKIIKKQKFTEILKISTEEEKTLFLKSLTESPEIVKKEDPINLENDQIEIKNKEEFYHKDIPSYKLKSAF